MAHKVKDLASKRICIICGTSIRFHVDLHLRQERKLFEIFPKYFSFLHHHQLACHDLALTRQKHTDCSEPFTIGQGLGLDSSERHVIM